MPRSKDDWIWLARMQQARARRAERERDELRIALETIRDYVPPCHTPQVIARAALESKRDEALAKVKQLEEQLRYANGTWEVGKDGQPL